MPTVRDISKAIEQLAPLPLQESYDNAGLLCGDAMMSVTGALIALDVTEAVVEEAIEHGLNMVIAHHPLIFSGLKKLTGKNYVERCLIKAIKNDIAIYAAHTNIDAAPEGLNALFCKKLGLENCKILAPSHVGLVKLVTFAPTTHAEKVRKALFSAGAGHIGKYDQCSYAVSGEGTFRASENSQPFVGEIGERHTEAEMRIETVLPEHLTNSVISALKTAHPYEEVAYDLYPLNNKWLGAGSGMLGSLNGPLSTSDFLELLKRTFKVGVVRYTNPVKDKIQTVAVCGGSGSFLIKDAIAAEADIFITGEIKYHEFFLAEERLILADIGHFESEQFVKELFEEVIKKNFSNFAVRLSQVNTNPIKYL